MSESEALIEKISSNAFNAEALVNSLIGSSTILSSGSAKAFSAEDFRGIDAHISGLLSNLDKLEADLNMKQEQAALSFQRQRTSLMNQVDKSGKHIGEFKTQVMSMESLVAELSSLSQTGAEAIHTLIKGQNLQKALFLLRVFNEFVLTRLLGGISLQFEIVPLAKSGHVVIDQLDYEQLMASGSLYKTATGSDPELPASNTYYSPDCYFVNIDVASMREGTQILGTLGYTPYKHPHITTKEDTWEYLLAKQDRATSSPYEDSPFIPPAFRYLLANPFTRHQMLLTLKELISTFDMHNMLSVPRFDCLENVTFSESLLSIPELRSRLPSPLFSEQLNTATVETVGFIKRLYESITSVYSLIPYPPTSAMSQRLSELTEVANMLISMGPERLSTSVEDVAQAYGLYIGSSSKMNMPDSSKSSNAYAFSLYRHRYGLLYELCCALDHRTKPNLAKVRRIVMTMDLLGMQCYDMAYESIAYACIKSNSHLLSEFASNPLWAIPENIPDVFADLASLQTTSTPIEDGSAPSEGSSSSQDMDIFSRVFSITKGIFSELTAYFTSIFHILKGLFRICFLTVPKPQSLILHLTQLVFRVMMENITNTLSSMTKEYVNDQARMSLFMTRISVILKSLTENLVRSITSLTMTELMQGIDISGITYNQCPLLYGYDFRFSATDEAKFVFTDNILRNIQQNMELFRDSNNPSFGSVGGINPQVVASIFAPFEDKTESNDALQLSQSVISSQLSSSLPATSSMDINLLQLMMYPISDIRASNLYSWSYYFDADEELDSISWSFDEYFVSHYLTSNNTLSSNIELSTELSKRKELYERTQSLYLLLCDICKGALAKQTSIDIMDGPKEDGALVFDLDSLESTSINIPAALEKLSLFLTRLDKYKAPAFVEDSFDNYYKRINRGDFKFQCSLNNSIAMRLIPQLPAFMSKDIFLNKFLKTKETTLWENVPLLELLSLYKEAQTALLPALTSSMNKDLSNLVHQFLPIYCSANALKGITTYVNITAPWPFVDRILGDRNSTGGTSFDRESKAHPQSPQLEKSSEQILSKLRAGFLETAEHAIKLLFQDYFFYEDTHLESYFSGTTMLEPFRSHHEAIDTLILNTCSKGLSSSLFSESSLLNLIAKYKVSIYRTRYMFLKPPLCTEDMTNARHQFYVYRTQTFQTVQTALIRCILAFLSKKMDSCITGYASLCYSAAAGYFPEMAVQDSSSMKIHDTTTVTRRLLPLLITCPPGVYSIEPISKNAKLINAWREYGEYIISIYSGEGIAREAFSLSQCRISDSGTPLCFGHTSVEYNKKGSGYSFTGVTPILLSEKLLDRDYPSSVTQSRSFATIKSGLFIPLSDQFFDIISAILAALKDIDEFLLADVLEFESNSELTQIIRRELERLHAAAELALHRLSNVYVELVLAGCRIIFCKCRSNSYTEADIARIGDHFNSNLTNLTYEEFCQLASKDGNHMINPAERLPLHVRYIFELLTNQLQILVSKYDFQAPCSQLFPTSTAVCRNLLPAQSAFMIAGKILSAFPTLYLAHLSRFHLKDRDPLLVIAEVRVLLDLYHTLLSNDGDFSPSMLQELHKSMEMLDLIKAVLLSNSSSISSDVCLMIRKCYVQSRAEVLLLLQILARRLSPGLGFVTTGEPTRKEGRFRESAFNNVFDSLYTIVQGNK